MNVKKILVIGSFMMDLVAQTPRAPIEGETIIGKSFSQFTGGKGANQAVAAARLGAYVTMIGKLGKDSFGEAHIESLRREGINHDYVLFDDVESSGVGHITLEENGNNRIIVIPGANLKLTPKEVEDLEDNIKSSDIVILQLEIPFETVYKTIELAHKHGKTIILNPAPAAKLKEHFVELVDYIVPNESEASLLTGIKVNSIESARKAAKSLLNLGCKNVIITLGEKGVLLVNNNEEIFQESFKVKPVDTTAAGDSFIGAFAYSLANGLGNVKSLEFACAVGALTVTKIGAQPSLPKLTEVEMFMKENR
ncbi:ribokinase [Clostridium tetani]|uniref:Deoxyribokinase n=1 Tax=Clostridium tetani (strain Massachusetts / E88) TaxID=212717 RepID=Q896T9_CLOTE|nr:ribokinase [Clostridium tetani E88]